MAVILATGLHQEERELQSYIGNASICYSREALLDVVTEYNAESVVISPHLSGEGDLLKIIGILCETGRRVIFVPGGEQIEDIKQWMMRLIPLGVYDYVFHRITPEKIVARIQYPASREELASELLATGIDISGMVGPTRNSNQPDRRKPRTHQAADEDSTARPFPPPNYGEPYSENMASVDFLTGFLLRHSLPINKVVDHTGVLFCDLDNFKPVNDRYGHAIGDKVLQEFARVLERAVRADDLPIRWGGDEFVVVLPDATLTEAQAVAERIRQHWLRNHLSRNYKVTVSIGCAAATRDRLTLEQVIAAADAAMYQEKKGSGQEINHIFSISTISISDEFLKQIKNCVLVDLEGSLSAEMGKEDLWRHDCRMGLRSEPLGLPHKVLFYGLSKDISGFDEGDRDRISRLIYDLVAKKRKVVINVSNGQTAEWVASLGGVPLMRGGNA